MTDQEKADVASTLAGALPRVRVRHDGTTSSPWMVEVLHAGGYARVGPFYNSRRAALRRGWREAHIWDPLRRWWHSRRDDTGNDFGKVVKEFF